MRRPAARSAALCLPFLPLFFFLNARAHARATCPETGEGPVAEAAWREDDDSREDHSGAPRPLKRWAISFHQQPDVNYIQVLEKVDFP